MRRRDYLYCITVFLCINLFSSCIDKGKDIYDPDQGKEELDLSFQFETRRTATINLTAYDEFGELGSKVLFSIYSSNPDDGEGGILASVKPIYQGYTQQGGTLSASIDLPNGTENLYITPNYVGFGEMKIIPVSDLSQTLIFKGTQLTLPSQTRAATSSQDIALPYDETMKRGENFCFYSYFKDGEDVDKEGRLLLTGKNPLISYEKLSIPFKELVNSYFIERSNFYNNIDVNTDLIVTDENDTEVWVTYLGDGGYVNLASGSNKNIRNSLYYYTYTESNKPDREYMDKENGYIKNDTYQLTAVFPNIHPSYIATGTKVQLLYYDKATKTYRNKFPKGTHISFGLNNKGFNVTSNSGKNSYFNTGFGYSLSTSGGCFFSTAAFNPDQRPHGIAHYNDTYNCYIIGMENNGTKDKDYNDALIKVTSSHPLKQIGVVEKPDVNDLIGNFYAGTLAFEDQWPDRGDYDFNDFVTYYEYQIIKNTSNEVTAFRLTFTPQAVGASTLNGFGIQLPVTASQINQAKMKGGTLESGTNLASVILYQDVRNAFGGQSGFINTPKGSSRKESTPSELYIPLNQPISEKAFSYRGLNPFLFVKERGREIHLVDYPPTGQMNLSLFGTGQDRSNASKGIYYRMDNNYPWALDISDLWKWPTEGTGISSTYKYYDQWTKNKSDLNWFDSSKAEYVEAGNLY